MHGTTVKIVNNNCLFISYGKTKHINSEINSAIAKLCIVYSEKQISSEISSTVTLQNVVCEFSLSNRELIHSGHTMYKCTDRQISVFCHRVCFCISCCA